MIRIEGIPIVASRLAHAQKAKSTKTRGTPRRALKIAADAKVRRGHRSAFQVTGKVA